MTVKFDYDDVVRVIADAPSQCRPGEKGWIVGVYEERTGAFLEKFPIGTVYTIEFEDGSSAEVHEKYLAPESLT